METKKRKGFVVETTYRQKRTYTFGENFEEIKKILKSLDDKNYELLDIRLIEETEIDSAIHGVSKQSLLVLEEWCRSDHKSDTININGHNMKLIDYSKLATSKTKYEEFSGHMFDEICNKRKIVVQDVESKSYYFGIIEYIEHYDKYYNTKNAECIIKYINLENSNLIDGGFLSEIKYDKNIKLEWENGVF